MSNVRSLAEALERFVPPFDGEPDAWSDVLVRAGVSAERSERTWRPRRLTIALAFSVAALVALGVSPVGSAVARGVADFSAWLTGDPGDPASDAAQRAFDADNERSWGGFPSGTKLRSLIVTQAAGGTFELFGFRSGDSLCLRLAVTGMPSDEKQGTSCTPLDELRSAEAPAVIATLDYTFGREDVPPNDEGLIPARASATFGVVADGVTGVELTTNEGRHEAIVRNNAFLSVIEHPPLGTRTKEMAVLGENGQRLAVPLAEAPFGDYGVATKPGVAPGPTKVERHIANGTIGWLVRREARGQSLTEAGLGSPDQLFPAFPGQTREVKFARVVQPDPQSPRRVVIGIAILGKSPVTPSYVEGEQLCSFLFTPGQGSSGGCSPVDMVFKGRSFTPGVGGGYGGDQRVVVSGLASDDVARMVLFLADGEQRAIPLNDNFYAIDVERLEFPIRVVAYDNDDRVIGIWTYNHDPLGDPGPRPVEGKQRIVRRVTAPDGSVGTLRMGSSTEGTVCWKISFRDGHGGGGCQMKRYVGPPIAVSVDSTGIVMGSVSPRVERAELELRDGRRVPLELIDGVVFQPLTRDQWKAGAAVAIAYGPHGGVLERQELPR